MYTSSLLSKYSSIEHGFIGRDGMKKENVLKSSVVLKQVHGDSSVFLDSIPSTLQTADASITKHKGLSLAIKTADCVPILMYSPKLGIVAAIHAGWKGTLSNVAGKTAQRFVDDSADFTDIRVAFGPSIGPCCYYVEKERAKEFLAHYDNEPSVVSKMLNKYYLNLMWANVINLIRQGIVKNHIDTSLFCTKCQKDKFFSYRAGDSLATIKDHNISYIKLIA